MLWSRFALCHMSMLWMSKIFIKICCFKGRDAAESVRNSLFLLFTNTVLPGSKNSLFSFLSFCHVQPQQISASTFYMKWFHRWLHAPRVFFSTPSSWHSHYLILCLSQDGLSQDGSLPNDRKTERLWKPQHHQPLVPILTCMWKLLQRSISCSLSQHSPI